MSCQSADISYQAYKSVQFNEDSDLSNFVDHPIFPQNHLSTSAADAATTAGISMDGVSRDARGPQTGSAGLNDVGAIINL